MVVQALYTLRTSRTRVGLGMNSMNFSDMIPSGIFILVKDIIIRFSPCGLYTQ